MAYVQNQQRGIKRSLTRMLIGFFVPLLFLGGLVVTGFVVYNNFEDEINDVVNSDVFSSGSGSDPGPAEPVDGVVGTLAEVTLGENSYDSDRTGKHLHAGFGGISGDPDEPDPDRHQRYGQPDLLVRLDIHPGHRRTPGE
jgi:hypothetical protein